MIYKIVQLNVLYYFFTAAIHRIGSPPVSPRHREEPAPIFIGPVTRAEASTQTNKKSRYVPKEPKVNTIRLNEAISSCKQFRNRIDNGEIQATDVLPNESASKFLNKLEIYLYLHL
jgi:hypothetical protein